MSESSRWITVGELAHAFAPDSHAGEPTADLSGKESRLYLDDGRRLHYRFLDGTRLSWSDVGEGNGATETEEAYFAAKIRQGIYFVDHLKRQEQAVSISLVLDLDLRILTMLTGTLPEAAEARLSLAERAEEGKELTAVATTFSSGAIEQEFGTRTPRHLPTLEMVGRRVEYTYSPTERYEHVYLNEHFYTWHCLLGAEKGLADTDRCHYYRLADDLYLFVWREKIVPTLGVVVVDFAAMRTTGKIFGYQGGRPGRTANFIVGARARLLNVTNHASTQAYQS
jgi:hypothetical protein